MRKKKDFFISPRKIDAADRKFYCQFRDFCREKLQENEDPYFRFGYETFGIILYGFCRWMIQDLKKQKISKILFFSRDGYILKEAFEKMPESKEFDIDYIYVSRRSLRVPFLCNTAKAEISRICPTRYISLEDLLVSIGLEPDRYQDILHRYSLSLDLVIKDTDIENNSSVSEFLNEIWREVVDNAQEEYKSAKAYINQFSLSRQVAVVDIGWRGSMQYFLGEMLNSMEEAVRLRGYYITLSSSMKKGIDMHGYLQNVDNNSKGCDLLRGYVGLMETLFLKSEGSVEKYKEDPDGRVKPILFPCEYETDDAKEVIAVQKIQEGALQFIEDYIQASEIIKEFSSETAFANLSYFGNHPAIRDVKMFADFKFYNGTTSTLADAKPIWQYFLCPQQLKRDFYGCRWRIGFLKKLFRIPFPYYGLFRALMKMTL